MLDKIFFRNGVVVKAEYLNEVQRGTIFSTTDPRIDYYNHPTDLDHDGWAISTRDGLKDWEFAHPDIEPQTNIGRLAHDAVILGCINCAETDLEEIDVSYNYAPGVSRKDIDDSILSNDQIGVFVSSGRVLGENLEIIAWDTTLVIVEPNSVNYIYAYYEESTPPVLVANSQLPSRSTLYTPIARVTLNSQNEISDLVDLRHGVYIDSLLMRSNNLKNTELININTTIDVWQRAVVDTSNGEIYITLPASAVNNDLVSVVDASATFNTNPVHILPNGSQKINNSASPLVINKASAQLNMFFFEPLNTWLLVDDYLSEASKNLGEFISCGGWEYVGIKDPADCPHGEVIAPVFPNPSEGTYSYDSISSKCYKSLAQNVSVYSDGEGGFIKIFNERRCLKTIAPPTPTQYRNIKVNLDIGDDSISNSGTITPFKTLERALLECAKRRSYFDKLTIELEPDEYYVDNNIGSGSLSLATFDESGLYFRTDSTFVVGAMGTNTLTLTKSGETYTTLPRFLSLGRVLYSESGSNAVVSRIKRDTICVGDCGWEVEIKYLKGEFKLDDVVYFDNFSVLNPTTGGVIIPNGVSIVSNNSQKTRISPVYVPAISNGAELSTSIFKVTGNTHISNITFTDNTAFTKSHSKLCSIQFASESELALYYEDKLGNLFEFEQEFEPVIDVHETSIIAPEDLTILTRLTDNYENITGTEDIQSEVEPINGDSAPYSESGYIYYPGKIQFAGYIIPDVNNIRSASPYIDSCRVRSNFGLSGIFVDGLMVQGAKSFLVSNFNVVSLQIDPNCFVNSATTYYNYATDSTPKTYKSEQIYRSYGIKAINAGVVQANNCSVVAAADHYITESGGEISLFNSSSNYGEKALVSLGYKATPYPQDFSDSVDLGLGHLGTIISKLIRPKPLSLKTKYISTKLNLDINATRAYYNSLGGPTNNYRMYIRTPQNRVPSAAMMSHGEFAYTSVEAGSVSLATGVSNVYRNYFVIDALTFVSGRFVRTSYFTKIDDSSLVYSSEVDDASQIFKYDPSPVFESSIASGTYNLDRDTSTISHSDLASLETKLPAEFIEGAYFYIGSDTDRVYIITSVDTQQETANFSPGLLDSYLSDQQITFVSNDYLGGLWYVDVIDVTDDNSHGNLHTNYAPLKESFDNHKHLQGNTILTYRDVDTRLPDDRIYKFEFKGYDAAMGVRNPQEHYIVEANSNYGSTINSETNPLIVTTTKELESGTHEIIVLHSDDYKESDLYPPLNLDNPELTENPTQSLTYVAAQSLSNYSLISLSPADLIPSNLHVDITYEGSASPFLVELRKPSILRANSHSWEWVGHLNYDSSLISLQKDHFDTDTYLDVLITETNGGKVFAAGNTETGKGILNNKYIDTPTDNTQTSTDLEEDYTIDNFYIDVDIPHATEHVRGIAKIATSALVSEGSDDETIITPAKLRQSLNTDLPWATETVRGIAKLATQAEANSATNDTTIMTPLKVRQSLPIASETVRGIAELATQAEANTGTNDTNIMTPLKVRQSLPIASETVRGIAEIATQAEANAGTDDTTIMTPLKARQSLPIATETVKGIAEIATQAEADTGTNDTNIMTPLKVRQSLPIATETVKGIAELATQAEADDGYNDTNIMTPLKVRQSLPIASETVKGIAELATQAEANSATDDTTIMTPLKVRQSLPAATENVKGIAEIATLTEATTADDDSRIMTPLKVRQSLPIASETVNGIAEIATQAEANAGTNDTTIMTPLKVRQSLPIATETVKGIAELATQGEANEGTDDTTIMTPLKVRQSLPIATENVKGIAEIATQAEANAGTDDTTIITPLKLRGVLDIRISPEVLDSSPDVTILEGQTVNVDLTTIFEDSTVFNYTLVENNYLDKISTYLIGSTLTIIAHPRYSEIPNSEALSVKIKAESITMGTSIVSLGISVTSIATLFTEPLWSFDKVGDVGVGANLYAVGNAERAILAVDPAVDDLDELAGRVIPTSSANLISDKMFESGVIVGVKLYSDPTLIRWIFANTGEDDFIDYIWGDAFTDEGIKFYAWRGDVNRGTKLKRYQRYSDNLYRYTVFNSNYAGDNSVENYEGVVVRIIKES